MKYLITGAAGQLGEVLASNLKGQVVAVSRDELDICSAKDVNRVIQQESPDVVINTAAYTAVDRAEQEQDLCYRVNQHAVSLLAEACRDSGALLVQISSDYIFCGDARTPHRETSPPVPRGIYAKSKLLGEEAAQQCPRHLIVRTCGLYGHSRRSPNFVKTMLRLGKERGEVRVVDDQWCTPTYVPHLVDAIIALIDSQAEGTFHVVNQGEVTWCRFAQELFSIAGMDVTVHPITTEQFGAPAPRPAYSVLDTSKFTSVTKRTLPTWQQGLQAFWTYEQNLAAVSV